MEVRWLQGGASSGAVAGLRPSGPEVHPLEGGGGFFFELDRPGKWVLEVGGLWHADTLKTGLMVFVSEPVRVALSFQLHGRWTCMHACVNGPQHRIANRTDVPFCGHDGVLHFHFHFDVGLL